jgi:hypothetical protein
LQALLWQQNDVIAYVTQVTDEPCDNGDVFRFFGEGKLRALAEDMGVGGCCVMCCKTS